MPYPQRNSRRSTMKFKSHVPQALSVNITKYPPKEQSLQCINMRRLPKLNRSIDLLDGSYRSSSKSFYVCLACRSQLHSTTQRASFSSTAYRAKRDPSNNVPFTEKIRRRIWGTDSPPGAADPYGDLSKFDRTKKGEQGVIELEEGVKKRTKKNKPAIKRDRSDYVPATSWEGLELVGVSGGRGKRTLDEEYQFRGYALRLVRSLRTIN